MNKNVFQLASTVNVEAIDKHSLAVYNDKLSRTQIIDASFSWLITLLASPHSYTSIKKNFALAYPKTQPDEICDQLDSLLTVFIENSLINKVAKLSEN